MASHQQQIHLTLPQYVEKSTDELLNGPDWAMNMALCDIVNTNPQWYDVNHIMLNNILRQKVRGVNQLC